MSAVKLVLIAAVAQNGVIGRDNGLIWRLKDDLKRFRALTMGKPVIMGRKTFQSLGKPLPGRINLVVTRDPEFVAKQAASALSSLPALSGAPLGAPSGAPLAELHTLPSPAAALAYARQRVDTTKAEAVYCIGGGELYAALIGAADRLEITQVALSPQGDTCFPPIEPAQWREVSRQVFVKNSDNDADFAFITYLRR